MLKLLQIFATGMRNFMSSWLMWLEGRKTNEEAAQADVRITNTERRTAGGIKTKNT
jgi:hypothetical protein